MPLSKRLVLAFGLCILLALHGRAHALMAGSLPDTPEARIDPNTTASPWSGVGSISIGGNTYSGTLIAPDYVLTAAHVAAGAIPESITFNLNHGGNLTQQIGVSAVFIHPGFQGVSRTHLANDLALIKLSQPAPADVPVYGLYRNRLPQGVTLTLVGYGASGNGDSGVTEKASPSVKRRGKNAADRYGAGGNGPDDHAVYYFDFDGPVLSTNRMGGGSLGNSLETSLADGDSGSPAFVRDRSGHWLLAGVNTFRYGNAPTFGNGGGGQLVSDYAKWIDNILSPVTPIPEPGVPVLFFTGAAALALLTRKRT